MHLRFFATRGLPLAALLLALTLFAGPSPASAATTRTWTGAVNANWSNAGNWNPAGAPAPGDQLVFPAPGATTNNDITGLDVVSVTVQAGYTFTGNSFTVDSALSVLAGATLRLQSSVTMGGLAGGGEVRTESAAVVLTVAATIDTTFDGVISGPGSLAVNGASLFAQYGPTFTGINTYTGPTTVNGGGIGLGGGSIAASSSLVVYGQGVVGGIGALPASSFMNALLFPGVLGQPGHLTAPSLALSPATVARFFLGTGADPALYDTVAITGGALNLGGATLELRTNIGQAPIIGSKFAIITGASSVAGTFRDLPEGAVFTRGGNRYSITYRGGPLGHDVVITRLTAPPADLSVTKSSSNASMTPGGTLTFTVVVSNAGPEDAPYPVMSDTLPAAFLFQSITAPAGWSCNTPNVGSPGAITCNATSMAKNTQATFAIVVKVAAGVSGDISNGAAVSSSADDAATVNNSTSVTVRIASNARPYTAIAPMVASDGLY